MPVTTNGIVTPTTGDTPNIPADLLTMGSSVHTKVENAGPRAYTLEQYVIDKWFPGMAAGGTSDLYAATHTLSAGRAYWLEVDVHFVLNFPTTANTGGNLNIKINGTTVRALRWHNHGAFDGRYALVGTAKAGPFAQGVAVPILVQFTSDAGSGVVNWLGGNVAVRRIGPAA